MIRSENPGNIDESHQSNWRKKLYEVIFLSDTVAGRAFDLALIGMILISIVVVSVESVSDLAPWIYKVTRITEWALTVVFTIEYVARILALRHPRHYILSFFGIVDLLALLPTYLALFFAGSQYLIVIRGFRLLRIFRILKLFRFMGEANLLYNAIRSSMPKIIVFLITIINAAIISGTILYLIEGEASGFTSIPRSIYWAIVTMTTVGYGDISPTTPLGQTIASIIMILGYAILAVPTGIVSVELAQAQNAGRQSISCPACSKEGHDSDAEYCKFCGHALERLKGENNHQGTGI